MTLPQTTVDQPQGETFALPPGCTEGFVRVNGTRLHYVAAGAGPLVILLHGFPEFWRTWRHQLVALSAHFRVVAPDMRGYNFSAKPTSGYDVATLAADVRELVFALGERDAAIVGHDWGGAIAWVTAIREPEIVRRLVIINAPHPATLQRELRSPGQLLRSSYIAGFQVRGLVERLLPRADYRALRRVFRGADPEHTWLTDEDIQRYVDAIARPGALSAGLEYYRQLPRARALVTPLRVITAPTLILWGERDPYLGVGLLDGLEPWIRNLRMERFPTAGHWVNQQEPERVNAALLAFLSEGMPARS